MSDAARTLPALNEKPTAREALRAMPFVWRMVWEADRPSVVLQLLGAGLAYGSYAGFVYLSGAFTTALQASNWAVVGWVIGWFALAEGADVLSNYLYEFYSDRIRYRTEVYMKAGQFDVLAKLPYWVIEHPTFRALQHAMDQKAWLVQSFANDSLGFLRDVAIALGSLTAAAFLPWPAVVALLGTQVVAVWLGQRTGEYQWSLLSMETREGRRASYYAHSVYSPTRFQMMQTLGLTQPFLKRWRGLVDRLLAERIRVSRSMSSAVFWASFLRSVGFVAGLWFLVQGIKIGTATLSAAVMFVASYHTVGEMLGRVMRTVSWWQKEGSFFFVFKQFFSLPTERETGSALPKRPLEIRFDRVWFRYPGSKQDVLRDVSFSFKEGEHLALVGLNGAGKSTLLKLLLNVYEPTRGKILVNGVDLQEIKPSAWRRAVAVMSQQLEAFDDVLREQVKYGDYDQPEQKRRLAQALATSGLEAVAEEFEGGMETHAGKQYAMPEEHPIELSGGQNQILAIARTLYRNARLYIFDEPTSAVDAEKEERFFEKLPGALKSQAVLFVSHRFSTLRRAERILVLEHGALIEDGTHEALLALNGRYAELFRLQAKMYQ
jgi:ATP-binding cassette subfamily B protein